MKSDISVRGGSNLRYMRTMRCLSLSQLSALMMERFGEEVSESTISRYESGDRPLTQQLIVHFAACLNCSVATLMDGLDLSQPKQDTVQELRMLSPDSHETAHWISTKWQGDADALITAWGAYAATPGPYRKFAMMELLIQMDHAIHDGKLSMDDIPPSVLRGLPHVEELLGGLYEDK